MYLNIHYLFIALALFSVNFLKAQNSEVENHPNISKPNIIFILPDDLGWNDVGYHGSFVKTPHLDRLAAQGAKLEQHYVMPSCTPSRVSLITGKYPSRYGILAPAYGEVIDLGDPTLASLLSELGYYTSISGKWHMGSPPYTPLKYGFQSSYGYFDGQIDPYTHEYKRENKEAGTRSWHRNDEFLDEEGHATDLITEEAIRVIREQKDDPFFLYVAYSVPHYPLSEPTGWTSLYDEYNVEPSRKWNAASISHMDAGIGRIIDVLEETGQEENTLVIFVSDNGGQSHWQSDTEYHGAYADKPHTVLGDNYPLRGWKTDLYEGGIRVPAFAWWPGVIAGGTVINTPIHIADWLPTLINLASGAAQSDDLNLDGKDIWALFDDTRSDYEAHPFYWKIREGIAVREGKWKMIAFTSGRTELYNIEEDFRETRNVSTEHPEIIERLSGLMEDFQKGDRK